MELRILTAYGAISVRYGGSLQSQKESLVQQLFRSTAARVWPFQQNQIDSVALDKEALFKQQQQIQATGSSGGYVARPFHDLITYPELADDPANVRFVRI